MIRFTDAMAMNSMNRRRALGQKGSILPLVAMVMLTLTAFLGMAFDASYLYYFKRKAQTAADSGAIGGAQELLRGNSAGVVTAARKDTGLNQFTHGVNSVDVTVNNPPVSGSHIGDTKFVEVIVTRPRPTWFMQLFGLTSSAVKARAVAGMKSSEACVYALNRDASNQNNGVFLNGTTSSTFGCSVYSNSNVRAVGGGCLITPSASYTGSYSNSNSSDPNCGPDSVGHGLVSTDPVTGLFTIPATSPCAYNNYKVTSGSAVTLTPGVYCGGIELGGSVPSATFTSGTYVLVGGGLKIGSSVAATGSAVTFFNTYPGTQSNKYGPITITSSSVVSFTAPVSGPNRALLFYQDPRVPWASNNGSTITGGSTSSFEGILYFPSTDLAYSGNSSTTGTGGYTLIVAYNLEVKGNAQVNSDFAALGGFSPFQKASFVE